MSVNIAKDVAAQGRLTVKDLRAKHVEVFGEATRSGNKDWLRKRIAWRIQANASGDLSERARRRAAELANDADLRTTAPKVRPDDGAASTARPRPAAPSSRALEPQSETHYRRSGLSWSTTRSGHSNSHIPGG